MQELLIKKLYREHPFYFICGVTLLFAGLMQFIVFYSFTYIDNDSELYSFAAKISSYQNHDHADSSFAMRFNNYEPLFISRGKVEFDSTQFKTYYHKGKLYYISILAKDKEKLYKDKYMRINIYSLIDYKHSYLNTLSIIKHDEEIKSIGLLMAAFMSLLGILYLLILCRKSRLIIG